MVLAFVIALITAIGISAQNASNAHLVQVPQGEKRKVQGVVSFRSGDSFKVREPGGAEIKVLLTSDTDMTSHSRGLKGKKDYPVTYIMRGLRLQAQGKGDAEGNLVAEWVRFDEQRLVQPFGYGDSKPVADNKTAAGAQKNRRVEIRILQNKGIANKGD